MLFAGNTDVRGGQRHVQACSRRPAVYGRHNRLVNLWKVHSAVDYGYLASVHRSCVGVHKPLYPFLPPLLPRLPGRRRLDVVPRREMAVANPCHYQTAQILVLPVVPVRLSHLLHNLGVHHIRLFRVVHRQIANAALLPRRSSSSAFPPPSQLLALSISLFNQQVNHKALTPRSW